MSTEATSYLSKYTDTSRKIIHNHSLPSFSALKLQRGQTVLIKLGQLLEASAVVQTLTLPEFFRLFFAESLLSSIYEPIYEALKAHIQCNPDFSSLSLKGHENWFGDKSGVRNIGGKITVKQIQGKRLLLRVIGVFEKSRVREIGIPLHVDMGMNNAIFNTNFELPDSWYHVRSAV